MSGRFSLKSCGVEDETRTARISGAYNLNQEGFDVRRAGRMARKRFLLVAERCRPGYP